MSKKSLCTLPVLGLWLLTFVSPARSWGGEDLLDLVRAGNQAALQSIRTLSCQITLSDTPRLTPFLGPAEYWRSGDSFRIRVQGGKEQTDRVVRDLKSKSVRKFRDPQGQETIHVLVGHGNPGGDYGPFNALALGLFSFPGPENTAWTFDEVLRKPHMLQSVKRETKEGRQLIVVKFSNEPYPTTVGEYEIWFDPQVNYLARKVLRWYSRRDSPKPDQQRSESEVLRFKEAAPAVYFPEQVEWRNYTDDQLSYTKVVKFSEIRINQPLPPGTLDFPPTPGGAVFFDTIQNKAYKTDAHGNPIGASSAMATVPPLPAGTQQPTETVEEPKSLTRWILPVSLALLALAGGLWIFRKWRPAAEVKTGSDHS